MIIIKRFLPFILIFSLTLYSFQTYEHLPVVVISALPFLPLLMALVVAAVSIYFHRSSLFFYLLLIVMVNVVLGMGWAYTELAYGVFACLSVSLLLIFSLLPERGIFSMTALPAYAVLLLAVVFFIVASSVSPLWLQQLTLTNWLPPRYFDWTPLPQTMLALSLVVFVSLLVMSLVNPLTHRIAAFGIFLLLVVQLHYGDISRSLTILSSGALLMCLYAILRESWRMAYLDELTELPGRRALREKFQEISGRYTVAMLDVDHFKKFNDTYGHDTGDAVLRMIAGKLSRLTGGGVAYRYGGEEFALVFNGKSHDQVEVHLERLRTTIAETPFVVNREDRRNEGRRRKNHQARTVQVTVSIGVADSGRDNETPWDVMKLADQALYRAKKQGRNRLCTG